MKTSMAKRAMNRNPIKYYVLGWCVEVDAGTWKETLRKDGLDMCRLGAVDNSGIWTKEKAVALARKHQATAQGWKWYAREMIYSTPNPENAKGLREVQTDYQPEIAT